MPARRSCLVSRGTSRSGVAAHGSPANKTRRDGRFTEAFHRTATTSTGTWSVQELHTVVGRQVCGSKASTQAGLHGGASRRCRCITGRDQGGGKRRTATKLRFGRRCSRGRLGEDGWRGKVVHSGGAPSALLLLPATASRRGFPERLSVRLPRTTPVRRSLVAPVPTRRR
jgi:hypothetical protein